MTTKFTIPIFSIIIFIFFIKSTFSQSSSSDLDSNCDSRWIHIRRLPTRFNVDLLKNCSEYPVYEDYCSYLANHGLGQKTHNSSHSWYRTDSFMLELVFHRRILEYPCLTSDPTAADAFFLPYYAGIDSLKYLYGPDQNSSFEHGLDLFHFLQSDSPELWNRNMGHDHFLIMARPAWDFSQPLENDPPIWGTSFLELPQFFNLTALIFESRAWPWQEQAIPYPTSFHPSNLALFESWVRRVRNSRRTTLALFAGGGGVSSTPNIRRSIRLECDNSTSFNDTGYAKVCEFVDCSNGKCNHDPILYTRPMLQSVFCLQPPGDTPTRRSTFDGLLTGCIPVFFEDQSARSQYQWHLPEDQFDEFSVSISKEEVVFKGLKIMDVLRNIPREKVRKMREKVIEIIPKIMYRKHGSSMGLRSVKDAFDIAIEGALSRIKTRLDELSVQ